MKNEMIVASWGKITRDAAAHDRILSGILGRVHSGAIEKEKVINLSTLQKRVFRFAIPAVLAVVICLGLAISFLSDDVKGLPTDDFIITDTTGTDKRMSYTNFNSFCYIDTIPPNRKSSIVMVKVVDVFDYSGNFFQGSILKESKVEIIANIRGKKLEGCIKTIQFGYGDLETNSNILRKGGVYILPLSKREMGSYEDEEGSYYDIKGDFDVLFEVDDKGFIHSHSQYKDFQRYNNRSYKDLLKFLKRYELNTSWYDSDASN